MISDADIIKVLECCEAPSDFYCRDCPLIFEDCHKIFLALINRQKAVICGLKTYANQLQDQRDMWIKKAEEQKAEIERIERHTEMHHEVRAEAIKEFAEMLREELKNTSCRFCEDNVFFTIKQLVEEMVGERE